MRASGSEVTFDRNTLTPFTPGQDAEIAAQFQKLPDQSSGAESSFPWPPSQGAQQSKNKKSDRQLQNAQRRNLNSRITADTVLLAPRPIRPLWTAFAPF